MDQSFEQDDLNAVIREHSELLANQLHAQGESLFPPDAAKTMRTFTSGEAAALLGVNDSYLRKLHLEGRGPSPQLTPGNRRHYSVHDLNALRVMLEKTARKPGDYLPGRRPAPDAGATSTGRPEPIARRPTYPPASATRQPISTSASAATTERNARITPRSIDGRKSATNIV